MKKAFKSNVLRLFNEAITDKNVTTAQKASDLLNVLQCKVTQPIQTYPDNEYTRVIYNNVSVTLENDLSRMDIAYNSDFQMSFPDISSCDLHQVSEFILALERDIPKWKHIWIASDKLRKEKKKIVDRQKSAMREFRSRWMEVSSYDEKELTEKFRIKYYNLKACELCIANENPFWENKDSEKEILEECRTFHLNPPMEQWYTEFTEFVEQCRETRDERDRQQAEAKRKQEKMRHLIQIKLMKFEALISSIEFHQDFSVCINKDKSYRGRFFRVYFRILDASAQYIWPVNEIDHCSQRIIDTIKRINDMIPELRNALALEGEKYYLIGDFYAGVQEIEDDEIIRPFTVVYDSLQEGRVIPCTHLSSSRIVNRINSLINELHNELHLNHA